MKSIKLHINKLGLVRDADLERTGSAGPGDRYLNHLYTNKKWHVKQERIQKGGLLDIEEAPVKTYYSDEEIWHVITTETGQWSDPWPLCSMVKYHKKNKKFIIGYTIIILLLLNLHDNIYSICFVYRMVK